MNDPLPGTVPHLLPLAGRIDASNATQLDDQLRKLIERGITTIVVDLGQVTYISSRGLRILLLAHRRQQRHGGRLVLRHLAPRIHKMLQLCGFDRLLEIEPEASPAAPETPRVQE